MEKVYLAGGFKSGWMNNIELSVEGIEVVNPMRKEYSGDVRVSMNVVEYATWDKHYIKRSDIVFAYVERTNPSCIGVSAEIGYAKGLGKTVILVLESNNETIKDSYLQFLTSMADITFSDFESGLDYLRSFIY